MQSIAIDIFLSCSFREDDAALVNLVKSICRALEMDCVNVSKGYGQIPPEKAREYIKGLPAVIAIATRGQRAGEKEYVMPSAVREEVSMAYALGKPILLIRESGVQFDGFMNNYGTHLTFSRDSAWTTEFIEKLVASIHTLKMDLVPVDGVATYPHNPDYYTEVCRGLFELEKTEEGFEWACTVTRRIKFCNDFKGTLRAGFSPEQVVPKNESLPDLEWHIIYESGSRQFELKPSVNQISAASLDLSIHVTPQPQENDFIEYTLFGRSRYLFPIYLEEAHTSVVIKDRVYSAFAGIIRSSRTDILKLQYRFPKEYHVNVKDITCLVATYSSNIEYVVESEMQRIVSSIDSFGGNVVVNLIASKPLLGCFYGIAWIPPTEG
jgi:hypothetical protein